MEEAELVKDRLQAIMVNWPGISLVLLQQINFWTIPVSSTVVRFITILYLQDKRKVQEDIVHKKLEIDKEKLKLQHLKVQ